MDIQEVYWAIPSRNLQKVTKPSTKQYLRKGLQNVTNILLFVKQVFTLALLCVTSATVFVEF